MALLSKGITLGYAAAMLKYCHKFIDDGSNLIIEVYADTSVLPANFSVDDVENYLSYVVDGDTLERITSMEYEDVPVFNGKYRFERWAGTGSDYSVTESADNDVSITELTNLQEIAELGNNAKEKIDITVLSDDAKKSMDGLADTAQDLAFKFLYEKEQFLTLSGLSGVYSWLVTLPDGTKATFTATPSVKLAGAGVSAALTYTLTLSVTSEIVFA